MYFESQSIELKKQIDSLKAEIQEVNAQMESEKQLSDQAL
jgi:hypothetical protein